MTLQHKGVATVEMRPDGRYMLIFRGEAIELIRRRVIQLYGRSTKRILKKRIKMYMMKIVIESAKQTVKEYSSGQPN